ncbi:MAG: nucleotide exchange factor GrpE [Planctomycetaceae bacterium]|nr:nucleotide exchange factor GrpE [Planctomycetaceae bacterium]
MSKEDKKAEKKIEELEEQLKTLQQEIETLKIEKQDVFEQLQRVGADYANYQKRTIRQITDSVAYEKKAIIRSILPSIDNFEHALAHAIATQGEEDNLVKGIQLVFTHLLDALKAHGVERIEAGGKKFDPVEHEAMMQRCEPDKQDNLVLEVYQTGYRMGDQIVRPAKVIVNKLSASGAQTEPVEPAEETTDVE